MTRKTLRLTVSLGLPSTVAVVLGLILGGAQVVNEVVLEASSQWHAFIAIVLVFGAGAGISPIIGPAFRAALHLPPWAGNLLSAGMGAAVLALSTVQMSNLAHAFIAAGLTVLAGLGFAPANVAAVQAPRPITIENAGKGEKGSAQ